MPAQHKQRGSVMLAIVIASSIAMALTGVAFTIFQIARSSQMRATMGLGTSIVNQASLTLTAESADSDNDGYPEAWPQSAATLAPTGGGQINAASAAPKTDPWGTGLGFCSWDNGGTNSSTNRITGDNPGSGQSILFAVVSAGPNKVFDTTCAQIKANAQLGDDIIIRSVVAQGRLTGGTSFVQDPVDCLSASNPPTATCSITTSRLDRLIPANGYTPRSGETRFVRQAGTFAFWDSTTQAWIYQIPKLSPSFTDGATCAYGAGAMGMDGSNNIMLCQ